MARYLFKTFLHRHSQIQKIRLARLKMSVAASLTTAPPTSITRFDFSPRRISLTRIITKRRVQGWLARSLIPNEINELGRALIRAGGEQVIVFRSVSF